MGLIVVTGPPAGGKTTWVRGNAKPGDIVIGYDLIAAALTAPGADTHRHPRILRGVAFRARRAALDEALRYLDQVDVYLIHSMPNAQARARYAEHGARVVVVDPGRDVVLDRISMMRSPTMVAVAQRWYASVGDAPSGGVQASRSW